MRFHSWTAIPLLAILMQLNQLRELAACGQLQAVLNSRISHGQDTHRWPWHAAIYHQLNETDPTYECGGTLISSKVVLTAAHCVPIAADRVLVSLGRLHLDARQSSGPLFKVTEILAHPGYNPVNYENDIAMVTLSTDAIFNSYVQPICLWNAEKLDLSEVIDKFGTVVGWGLTENGERSNALQEASLPVIPSFECLESNRDLFGNYLTDTNFCAGTRNGLFFSKISGDTTILFDSIAGTSVCSGDSGGSITFQENGRFFIRGIVSVGATKVDRSTNKLVCDSMQYALFTDVAQYLPWIRETIECEPLVECKPDRQTDLCSIILTVKESDRRCKIIFGKTSTVPVKVLSVSGDGSTATVPDLSNAVDEFEKLEKLLLYSFTLVERSRLSPFGKILLLLLQLIGNTQFDEDTFVDLNNLETLYISYSNLTTLPAGIFQNNGKIRDLFISNNQLQGVHEDLFYGLRNLERLDLSSNQIEYIPPGLFRTNSKLIAIYLAENKIKEIAVDFTTMTQLVVIVLDRNVCIDEGFNFPPQLLSEANETIRRACAN